MVYVAKLSISRQTYNQNWRELSAHVPRAIDPDEHEREQARLRMQRLRDRRKAELQQLTATGRLPPKNRIKKRPKPLPVAQPEPVVNGTPTAESAKPAVNGQNGISEFLNSLVWE